LKMPDPIDCLVNVRVSGCGLGLSNPGQDPAPFRAPRWAAIKQHQATQRSARVSDPAGTLTGGLQGLEETFGRNLGGVIDPRRALRRRESPDSMVRLRFA